MPRYFFHTFNATEVIDDDGVDLPDDNAARQQALALLGGELQDDRGRFWQTRPWILRVRDDSGRVVAVYTLSAEGPPSG